MITGISSNPLALHPTAFLDTNTSFYRWTVSDSRGNVVGGPSTAAKATGAPQNVGFIIDSPTNKDDTNIRMFYPDGSNV